MKLVKSKYQSARLSRSVHKNTLFSCRRLCTHVSALLLLLVGAHAHANQITSCVTAAATPGETMVCSFTSPLSLNISKTFGTTPGGLNVGLGLTNNIAGNNPSQNTTIYRVTETITNTSGVDWTDFHIFSPNASSLSIVTPGGFNTCDNAITCSGGVVLGNGGSFSVTFDLGTPSDQNAGAFALFESPSFTAVPEPASWTIVGLGLAALGLKRRRRGVAAEITCYGK